MDGHPTVHDDHAHVTFTLMLLVATLLLTERLLGHLRFLVRQGQRAVSGFRTLARPAANSAAAAPIHALPSATGHSETFNKDGKSDEGGDEGKREVDVETHGLGRVFGDTLFLTIGMALTAANAVIGMLEPLFQIYMTEKVRVFAIAAAENNGDHHDRAAVMNGATAAAVTVITDSLGD